MWENKIDVPSHQPDNDGGLPRFFPMKNMALLGCWGSIRQGTLQRRSEEQLHRAVQSPGLAKARISHLQAEETEKWWNVLPEKWWNDGKQPKTKSVSALSTSVFLKKIEEMSRNGPFHPFGHPKKFSRVQRWLGYGKLWLGISCSNLPYPLAIQNGWEIPQTQWRYHTSTEWVHKNFIHQKPWVSDPFKAEGFICPKKNLANIEENRACL